LRHPNIVQVLGVYTDKDKISYIVLEFVAKGSLDELIQKKQLTLLEVMQIAKQVVGGMIYLHDQCNVIHRDLSARNVLVNEEEGKYQAKLSDFGLSKQVSEASFYGEDSDGVPVKWSPPEVLRFRKFSFQSDVWSFGVFLWELLEASVPYPTMSNSEAMNAVIGGYRLPRPQLCNDAVYELMMKCWSLQTEERPLFKQISKTLEDIVKEIIRTSSSRTSSSSSQSDHSPQNNNEISAASVPRADHYNTVVVEKEPDHYNSTALNSRRPSDRNNNYNYNM